MHVVLVILAVIFAILGFVGFAYGGIPTIVFWVLAGLCIAGGWTLQRSRLKARSARLDRDPR